MAIDADHFLNRMYAGSELTYADQVIAEIIQINSHLIEIRDIHGKHWSINQDRLSDTKYDVFIENLAMAIARFHPDDISETSARHILNNMEIGDELQDQHAYLGKLIEIEPDSALGPSLIFQDVNENRQQVYLNLIPITLDLRNYLKDLRRRIQRTANSISEPILFNYFKNEFIPKLLAQMEYDNERWGDSWLFEPLIGQEKSISEHYNEYFDFYRKYGKSVPWLKVTGYAIIAQAREDHPDWLM